ncbi:hypothetical protein [Portibacter lacus]|nr:hypothetical protein [Portibacter lacus]
MKKILFIALVVFLGACREEKTVQVEEEPVLSTELPQGFHDFYDQFHSDSNFQMQHIIFPLKGTATKKDSMETITLDKEYVAENWKLHKPFNADAGFNRSFTAMGDLVIEKMQDDMGLFTIERRWGKVDSTWSLIYYGTTEKTW